MNGWVSSNLQKSHVSLNREDCSLLQGRSCDAAALLQTAAAYRWDLKTEMEPSFLQMEEAGQRAGGIGVLFGFFVRKIDGPGLPGVLIIYQGQLFPRKGRLWQEGSDG